MSTLAEASREHTVVPPGRWTVDPSHSAVEFEVRYLAITTVRGRFRDFEGALEVDDADGVRAYGVIDVASVETGAPERDAHLLSSDFFDLDRHPTIRYRLLALRPEGDGRYRLLGELTIRGVTRQVALDATVAGSARDPWGDERLGLELSGALSRREFGLRWTGRVDGHPILGDAVRLASSLSLVRESELGPAGGRLRGHARAG
jgi:polyisoprenoid-binding protein YceI